MEETKELRKEVILKIEGMHCGTCASGIQMMLSYKKGVIKAEVSYEDKKAIIEYDPSQIQIPELIKTIGETGEYRAEEPQ